MNTTTTTAKALDCICGVYFPAYLAPYKTQAAAKGQATILNKCYKDVTYRAAATPDADGTWGLERAQVICSPCSAAAEATWLTRLA